MRISRRTRIRYWWERFTDRYWQWGHPDDWSEAEWWYWRRDRDAG